MIKINNQEFHYKKGMTLKEALEQAGEETHMMVIVVVNGKVISKKDLNSTTIEDKAEIRLLPLVSGG